MEFREVYHASRSQGLKYLLPMKGTHGKKWLYAAKDINMASIFISSIGKDLLRKVGRDSQTGKPYVCERVKNAFDIMYKGKSGSIYVLPGKYFLPKTKWSEELASSKKAIPLQEIIIPDAKEYLLELEEKGEILIKRYPEKVDGMLDGDEDIIAKCVFWSSGKFQYRRKEVLKWVKTFRIDLLEEIERRYN